MLFNIFLKLIDGMQMVIKISTFRILMQLNFYKILNYVFEIYILKPL